MRIRPTNSAGLLPDPAPALRAMSADPWGGDVHKALACREHGGMQFAAFTVSADGAVAEHSHAFHELLVPLALAEGQQMGWRVDGGARRVVPLRPGAVLLAVAGQRHAADWRAGWLRLGVKIDPAWLAAFVDLTFGQRQAELTAYSQPLYAPGLADVAHQLLALGGEAAPAHSEVVTFVRHLFDAFGGVAGKLRARGKALEGDLLQIALELLAGPSISNSEVASRLGLSNWQFIRAFSAAMGLPPARWADRQRAYRAVDIIEQSPDVALPEVAVTAGYTSVRQMQRSFQSHFHYSPGKLPMYTAKMRPLSTRHAGKGQR